MKNSGNPLQRRVRLLTFALALTPILIASTQLYFSKTSTLTAWRGGGFGMYSEPHPSKSRSVWAIGTHEGVARHVRLWPLDPRLRRGADSETARFLRQIETQAHKIRDFPSYRAPGELPEMLRRAPSRLAVEFLPSEDVDIVVQETRIAPDWQKIETRILE